MGDPSFKRKVQKICVLGIKFHPSFIDSRQRAVHLKQHGIFKRPRGQSEQPVSIVFANRSIVIRIVRQIVNSGPAECSGRITQPTKCPGATGQLYYRSRKGYTLLFRLPLLHPSVSYQHNCTVTYFTTSPFSRLDSNLCNRGYQLLTMLFYNPSRIFFDMIFRSNISQIGMDVLCISQLSTGKNISLRNEAVIDIDRIGNKIDTFFFSLRARRYIQRESLIHRERSVGGIVFKKHPAAQNLCGNRCSVRLALQMTREHGKLIYQRLAVSGLRRSSSAQER